MLRNKINSEYINTQNTNNYLKINHDLQNSCLNNGNVTKST